MMNRRDVRLVVVTLFLLVAVVAGDEGDDKRVRPRCTRICPEWQCNYHCKRVGYASGKCYQNPYICNVSKGRIYCSCYRYYQPLFSKTTLSPVVITANLATEISSAGTGQTTGTSSAGTGQTTGTSSAGTGQTTGTSSAGTGQTTGTSSAGTGQTTGTSSAGTGQTSPSTADVSTLNGTYFTDSPTPTPNATVNTETPTLNVTYIDSTSTIDASFTSTPPLPIGSSSVSYLPPTSSDAVDIDASFTNTTSLPIG